jgi:hypothetical protein
MNTERVRNYGINHTADEARAKSVALTDSVDSTPLLAAYFPTIPTSTVLL